jgi:hypothetical protein
MTLRRLKLAACAAAVSTLIAGCSPGARGPGRRESPAASPSPAEASPSTEEGAAAACEPLERALFEAREKRNSLLELLGADDAVAEAGRLVQAAEEQATAAGCEVDNATLLERYGG